MRPFKLNNQLVRRLIAGLTALGLLLLPAAAAAQSVTQSYVADGTIQQGMIVMLDPKDSSKVQAVPNDLDTKMYGVAIAPSESVITLTGSGSGNLVYVGKTGTYGVLVSDQNGPIAIGDYITVSAIAGIGMKADNTQTFVLGKAAQAFTGKTNVSSSTKVSNTAGKNQQVNIGVISVAVDISHNPLYATPSSLPSFLKKAGQAIAGKDVSTTRMYVSLVILLLTILVVGSFFYVGVRGSVTSLGRNPLARSSIFRGLVQVVVIGLIVFVVGLFGVYLILKL